MFAHVSDLHLPFEPRLTPAQQLSKRQLSVMSWRRRRALHRSDILESLVRDLQAEAPDHVLVTGDIVNFSLPEEFRKAAGWLSALGPGGLDALHLAERRQQPVAVVHQAQARLLDHGLAELKRGDPR